MIVLWGVLRDVFPDSGSVPGQHWHQKIECNLHVYLRLFHGHSYSISTRQSCPKALICRHFYSVYRKDAVLQHLFCPAEYCVSVRCVVKHGAASRPWSWLICAVRVRCCFIPTVWGYSLVINKYIYINMIQLWLLCWVVSILWQCALRVRCCFIPRLWCCSYVIQLSLLWSSKHLVALRSMLECKATLSHVPALSQRWVQALLQRHNDTWQLWRWSC